MNQEKLQSITKEIENKLANINIELVDIEYRKESGDQILRIFIDTDSGVTLDTCSVATRAIKGLIDDQELDYDHLEVSSPGLDRILKKEKDFIKFMGHKIKVKMQKNYDGPKKFNGILTDYNNETITIADGEEIKQIPCSLVATVRLNLEN